MTNYDIYVDAGGNGSACAVAFKDDIRFQSVTTTTDAEAAYEGEYKALLFAMDNLSSLIGQEPNKTDSVKFYSDSEYMIKQINGTYKVRSQVVKPLHASVVKREFLLNEKVALVGFIWIPRDLNFAGRILEGKDKKMPVTSIPANDKVAFPKTSPMGDMIVKKESITEKATKQLAKDIASIEFDNEITYTAIRVLRVLNQRTFTLGDLFEKIQYVKDNPQLIKHPELISSTHKDDIKPS